MQVLNVSEKLKKIKNNNKKNHDEQNTKIVKYTTIRFFSKFHFKLESGFEALRLLPCNYCCV